MMRVDELFDPARFGRALVGLREDVHLSQRRLGQLAAVSNTAISDLEAGSAPPPHPTMVWKLAARIPFLPRGRSKVNGAGFYLVPGSAAGTVYYTSSLGCTCPGYRNRGVCAHQQACLLAEQRAAAARYEAAAPIREANRRAASERIQARRASWKSYADLFPADDDAEPF